MNFLFRKMHVLRYYFIGMMVFFGSLLSLNNAYANIDVHIKQMDRRDDGVSTRIVGGTAVPAGERTFQVALLQRNGQLWCGGSIIADNWVLTAAHCVEDSTVDQVLSGTRNLNLGGQRHSIVQHIIHPGYNGNVGAGYDIALIQINGVFSSYLERLKLATPAIMASNGGPGTGAVVSGWGRTSGGGTSSNVLLQTVNHIISDAQCEGLAGNIDTGTIICANDQYQSSCNGDSGGPLTIRSNGEYYSAGVVSFGPRSCSGYSAYSETAALRSWVTQHVDLGNGGNGDTELQNNAPISIAGSARQSQYYSFTLPARFSAGEVRISGGSGDADLYVRKGARPTDSDYDCRPYIGGNNEACSLSSAGTYYVRIKGYRNFNNVTLELSYQ